MSRPIMPTDLADVPAWLRFNARRWSMRILFLADELEMELERRAEFKRIAAAEGIRVIDIPRGLDHDELQAFITRNVTEPPAEAPLAVSLGNVVGHVVNELVPPRPKRTRECKCEFSSPSCSSSMRYSDDHCQACADDEPCTCDGCMP